MKRSISAPNVAKMIAAAEQLKPVIIQTNLCALNKSGLSTSNISLPGEFPRQPEMSPKRQPLSSPLPLSRMNSPTSKYRVAQIKKEETLDERANEREVQEQLILNKTMDDSMKIDDGSEGMEVWSLSSLPVHSAFMSPSSPLTTKIRSRSLTPTSPSSNRTFSYRRSCSPVLRPSSLCFGKRKREHDSEDMDTSPTVPSSKKQQLGFASPYSVSPCVSPLNSPLHHSFSRKSSTTQSELTPLSSPSFGNPFALKYDAHHGDTWQSLSGSGSACSSAGPSPSLGNTPTNQIVSRSTPLSIDELSHTKLRYINGSHDDLKATPMDSVDILTETPTPLSPKGLQFRQRPFPLSVATLQSPIPRSNGGLDNSFIQIISPSPSNHTSWASPNTSPVMRSQPNSPTVIIEADRSVSHPKYSHHHTLYHDRLSPFINTDIHSPIHPPRPIKTAKTRLQKTVLNSARQMFLPEPHRPGTTEGYIGRSSSLPSIMSSSYRLSSPLTKPGLNSNLDGEVSPIKAGPRTPVKRRMSTLSTGSQDDSLMESDDCSSFEETLPNTKIVRTIS